MIALTPYWQANPWLSWGLLLGLVAVVALLDRPAKDVQLPLLQGLHAGDQPEQGRFAGPIRADECAAGSPGQAEAQRLQGDQVARSNRMPDVPRLRLPHPVAGTGAAAMAELACASVIADLISPAASAAS